MWPLWPLPMCCNRGLAFAANDLRSLQQGLGRVQQRLGGRLRFAPCLLLSLCHYLALLLSLSLSLLLYHHCILPCLASLPLRLLQLLTLTHTRHLALTLHLSQSLGRISLLGMGPAMPLVLAMRAPAAPLASCTPHCEPLYVKEQHLRQEAKGLKG